MESHNHQMFPYSLKASWWGRFKFCLQLLFKNQACEIQPQEAVLKDNLQNLQNLQNALQLGFEALNTSTQNGFLSTEGALTALLQTHDQQQQALRQFRKNALVLEEASNQAGLIQKHLQEHLDLVRQNPVVFGVASQFLKHLQSTFLDPVLAEILEALTENPEQPAHDESMPFTQMALRLNKRRQRVATHQAGINHQLESIGCRIPQSLLGPFDPRKQTVAHTLWLAPDAMNRLQELLESFSMPGDTLESALAPQPLVWQEISPGLEVFVASRAQWVTQVFATVVVVCVAENLEEQAHFEIPNQATEK